MVRIQNTINVTMLRRIATRASGVGGTKFGVRDKKNATPTMSQLEK
jgi:hypothetical protein